MELPWYIYIILALIIGLIIYRKCVEYVQGSPNEWILFIENGKMKKAGIGIGGYKTIYSTIDVVRMPSYVQRVDFKATEVTKELHGVEMNGFCLWSIDPKDDSPFRAYKAFYGKGEQGIIEGKEFIQSIIEAELKKLIVTDTIENSIKDRNGKRTVLEKTIGKLEVLKEFGLKIERIELTDVKILSDSVFKSLQTEHREKIKQKAETIKNETRKVIEKSQMETNKEIETKKIEATSALDQLKLKNANELEILKAKLSLEQQKDIAKYEIEKLALQTNLAKNQQDFEKDKVARELEIEKKRMDFEMSKKKTILESESKMSNNSLQLRMMDSLQTIYQKLPLSDVKFFQVSENASLDLSLGSLSSTFKNFPTIQKPS